MIGAALSLAAASSIRLKLVVFEKASISMAQLPNGQKPETIAGSLIDEQDDGAQRESDITGKVDFPRIERAVREILLAVGEDPDREGLRETPARVGRMYAELFSGLHQDPRVHLKKFFTEKYDEIVLVRDISFESFCEHHLMPFVGRAHIAYLPDGRVIGLSKLARVVEGVARRPQVQERMTETIADLLIEELQARGVAVVVEAVHACMTVRGVRKPGAVCVTSAMKGAFRNNPSTRAEVMTLIYGEHR
jgi:GTP cyclohydrolase I